jgi:hypothetical protein
VRHTKNKRKLPCSIRAFTPLMSKWWPVTLEVVALTKPNAQHISRVSEPLKAEIN